MEISQTIKDQISHRTIREFKSDRIPSDILKSLLEVVNRTATSSNLQSASVIRLADPSQKQAIATVCNQEYAARVPELFIFIVDAYRNAQIMKELGHDTPAARDMDRFFQGFSDAVLAAQNLTNAVESIGLGAVYFGSILNDPDEIIRILGLPELTFPVLGVGFGIPNQAPQTKPRMPIHLRYFENRYDKQPSYLPLIAEYDKEMETYYDLREQGKRSDNFSGQLITRFGNTIEKRAKILDSVRRQGFELTSG
jgi:nitroreductase